MITVGIADEQPLVRHGIRGILEQSGDVRVVAEAGSGAGAVELVQRHRPRVLLADIALPRLDGVGVIETVGTGTGTAVVLLTSVADDTRIERALRAGAAGVLLKIGSPREVPAAVHAAAAGQAMLSPAITRRLLDRMADVDLEPAERARTLVSGLTLREREVLSLVATGMGNVQIARRLYISEGAVKAHVSRLLTKLSCANRVQAAILAHSARLAA